MPLRFQLFGSSLLRKRFLRRLVTLEECRCTPLYDERLPEAENLVKVLRCIERSDRR
jgi:hypothetical protein